MGGAVECIQSHLLKLSDAAPNMATSFTPALICTKVGIKRSYIYMSKILTTDRNTYMLVQCHATQ